MEPQKTLNSQSSLKKEKLEASQFQISTSITSHSNQNSMVLAESQTHINETEQKA